MNYPNKDQIADTKHSNIPCLTAGRCRMLEYRLVFLKSAFLYFYRNIEIKNLSWWSIRHNDKGATTSDIINIKL
jgi:hypothetical protein